MSWTFTMNSEGGSRGLLVSRFTACALHSAEIPTNSRKTLSEPRPVRFIASISTFTSLPASSQWSAAPTEATFVPLSSHRLFLPPWCHSARWQVFADMNKDATLFINLSISVLCSDPPCTQPVALSPVRFLLFSTLVYFLIVLFSVNNNATVVQQPHGCHEPESSSCPHHESESSS
ncbi:hypothetical protein F7725_023688 [Dissostichus mawsoni]|uniref:Uncharacterized protein n=1 Tax=Dissostichus mawsoni TaxID=36200 RepID=A0A7J5XZ05_DISMA|nr:hypothetical protein F7725_023688 [Dissostichus mawsoni]